MRQLISAYLIQKWRRDLLLLLLMPVCSAGIYIYFCQTGRTNIGIARHHIAQLWVVLSTAYAAITLFNGYHSSKQANTGLLLPATLSEKYWAEVCRTLVVYPIVTAALLLMLDHALTVSGIFATSRHLRYGDTLWQCMTYTSLPLYHLPVMPYFLVTFVAIATLARSLSGHYILWTIGILWVIVLLAIGAPGNGVWSVQTVYPFLSETAMMTSRRAVWIEPVTWTRLPMKVIEIISCGWLMLIPIASYILAFFNIKEISLRK